MSKFTITGFADEISSDFDEQLRELQALNIANMEIRGVNGRSIVEHSIDEVKAIKARLDDAGIGVSAVGSPIGKIQIEDDFEPHMALFKHTVEIAKILGTPYIRLFSFFMEEGTAQVHRDEVMRRMKAFVDYVEGTEIILLHENEKDIYGDRAEPCLDIVRTMDSPNLKLIFDPANFLQCGVETYPHAFDLLKEDVVYMHIKDAIMATGEVVPAGKGDGYLSEILGELDKKNYQGYLSLEPHLGEFEGFGDLEGDNEVPEFKEKSDAGKFRLAYESLMGIVEEL